MADVASIASLDMPRRATVIDGWPLLFKSKRALEGWRNFEDFVYGPIGPTASDGCGFTFG